MRFYVRNRRQAPTVIIVALIDILIVLVIFLLVTTTFKQQPAVKIALPDSTHAQKPGANEDIPLAVSIDAKGSLRLGPTAKSITLEQLKSELIAAVKAKPDVRVAINGDTNAPWGLVLKVMDITRDANVKVVNAAAKEAKR